MNSSSQVTHHPLHNRAERFKEYYTYYEVADAVYDVVGDTGDPPGKSHARPSDEKIGDRAEQPEEQADEGRQDTVKEASGLMPVCMIYEYDKKRPDVEIHKRPQIKALQHALDQVKPTAMSIVFFPK